MTTRPRFTNDGFGINGPDEYRSRVRVATWATRGAGDAFVSELSTRIAAFDELVNAVRGMDLACSVDLLNPCWNNRPDDITGKHWGNPTVPSCPQCAARSILAKVAS